MKTNIFTFFLCLLCITAFTQVNNGYEYRGRFTPVIKQEKIGQAKYLSEIMPEFCRYFSLPYKDHNKFKQRLKIEDMISETYNYSHKYYYHQEKFEKLIDYISVDISATCNGKILSAKSISNVISAEQKNILNTADPGSDISIKIKFKYNYSACEFPEDNDRILEGKYVVTVVPQNEAEYPGGHKQITSYLKENVLNKIPKTYTQGKIERAVVRFTINEEGKITGTKLSKTTMDTKIDKLLIDAINKMPAWKPAEDSKGKRIKQEYCIPLGGGGC